MLGLFSKKKGRKELRLEDVDEFVRLNTEKEFSAAENRLRDGLNAAMKEINSLKSQLKELGKISSGNSFSDNVKNRYCERVLGMLNVEAPDLDYSKITNFISAIENINKAANNLTIKEFKHMREFKANMGRISMQTKVIESKLKQLKNTAHGSVIEKKEKIKKCLNWINELNEKIFLLNEESEKINCRKDEIEKEANKLDLELGRFEKNGLQAKFDNELKELEAIEKHRDLIKQNIETEFGGLSRPLKRLQYALDSGQVAMLSDEKNILERYLDTPDAFLHDNKMLIKIIISKIKDLYSRNAIELNEKERDKVLSVHGNMRFLISLKEQYNGLSSQIHEKEEKIKTVFMPYAERKKEIQNEKEIKNRDREKLNNELKAKTAEIEKIRGKNISNIMALEVMLSEFFNADVKINY